MTTVLPIAAMAAPTTALTSGPAGSSIIVEESRATPLVYLMVATRSGSAADPRGKEGLTNLAGELARRGAAGRTRVEMDEAFDALGASLDVVVDPDSVRLVGHVLLDRLDDFLRLVADVITRPDFREDELERTRREILAQLDEMRNDDRTLCARYFARRLYGDHPYGRAADGTARTLARLRRDEAEARFRRIFVGRNLIFAAAGPLDTSDFQRRLAATFTNLREGPVPASPTIAAPAAPRGWRIQIVDKPDRQQTQMMWGHSGPPASHPDFLALQLAFASFGGQGMKSTLMDEVRTKRGLAYGAYMAPIARRGPGPVRGWVFSGTDRTVITLKLVLRLYRRFMTTKISAQRVRFFQSFLARHYASEIDPPDRRLAARVAAEVQGLPRDYVETFPARLRALTAEQVNAARAKHVRAEDLAITMVTTASSMTERLVKAGVDHGAIDVVSFDDY